LLAIALDGQLGSASVARGKIRSEAFIGGDSNRQGGGVVLRWPYFWESCQLPVWPCGKGVGTLRRVATVIPFTMRADHILERRI